MLPEDAELYIAQIANTRYALLGSFVLLVCEWLANLEDEWRLIHTAQSRWSLLWIAYLLCRYYPIVAYPVILWAYLGNFPAKFCVPIAHPVFALFGPLNVLGPGVMLLRAYAFTGRSQPVLLLFLTCYTTLIAVAVWAFWAQTPPLPPEWYDDIGGTGCFPDYRRGVMALRFGVIRLVSISTDLVSLLVVLLHCRRVLLSQWALGKYFVTQGLSAFALVALVNGLAVVMYFQAGWPWSRVGIPFIYVMSNIVACWVYLSYPF
ncbi:hypothetical protein BDN72DRAFT_843712 [Pluteus cervinus]|uniref:Uncharacterized protein n=1 Tax=Pluteus cervinus TaxID=181527 RepID=A0ACD3AMH8_9AGAR|nr:hypothetical protein BDN72DRAFT_843712 [Pluteus cervinus]